MQPARTRDKPTNRLSQTPEPPGRSVVCVKGPMSTVRLVFRCESHRTLGGIRPSRVGHLLGRPREHARTFCLLRTLVVPNSPGDDRRWFCRCGCAEVGSPCLLSGLVARVARRVDARRGGSEYSQPSEGAHRRRSIMGTGRSRRRTSAYVNQGVLGQLRARVAPCSIRRSDQRQRRPGAVVALAPRPRGNRALGSSPHRRCKEEVT